MNVETLIKELEDYPSTTILDLTNILSVVHETQKGYLVSLDLPIIGLTCADKEVLLVTESDRVITSFGSMTDLVARLKELPSTRSVELAKQLPNQGDYSFRLDFPIIGTACNDIHVVFVVEHRAEVVAFGRPTAL